MLSHFLVTLSAVFFVVDPVGVVPIFISLTAKDSPEKIRSMARRACLAAAGLLIFFALFGGLLFKVLGVSLSAFKVAGGILLLVTALEMLRARHAGSRISPPEEKEGQGKADVALVPAPSRSLSSTR